MKNKEINIRDPFVLVHDGHYYLYGTRAKTCWGKADGFDCYVGTDLENWEGPFEVFHRPEGFWADKNYWAPEVHFYEGAFYMFATFNSEAIERKGTMILKADNPLGPFVLHSEGKITPDEWNCLDGTLYVSPKGIPYMVFCHEWQDIGDGAVCCVELTKDLKRPAGDVRTLFTASQGRPWVRKIVHDRFPGDNYVTDGPFLYRLKGGELLMLWSSFGEHGYVEAISRSDNNDITGNWVPDEELLFERDGGHGMLFATLMVNSCSPSILPMKRRWNGLLFMRWKKETGSLRSKRFLRRRKINSLTCKVKGSGEPDPFKKGRCLSDRISPAVRQRPFILNYVFVTTGTQPQTSADNCRFPFPGFPA